jgi:hypothetical protein
VRFIRADAREEAIKQVKSITEEIEEFQISSNKGSFESKYPENMDPEKVIDLLDAECDQQRKVL